MALTRLAELEETLWTVGYAIATVFNNLDAVELESYKFGVSELS